MKDWPGMIFLFLIQFQEIVKLEGYCLVTFFGALCAKTVSSDTIIIFYIN